MNRQIKFRAWDGKKLHNWDSTNHPLVDEIKGTPYPKLFYLPMSCLVGDMNEWNWMQFTGLLDKNGKEIYEGDIVEVLDDIGGEITSGNKYDTFTVKIEDHSFMQFLEDMCGQKHVRILGNVWEQPELLTPQ